VSTQPWGSLAALDAWLADDLKPAKLAAKPFVPLPVLGVPGWWDANEAPGFYADPHGVPAGTCAPGAAGKPVSATGIGPGGLISPDPALIFAPSAPHCGAVYPD
jgi:hypothetical protein